MLLGPSSSFYSKLYTDGTVNSMSCGYESMINYAFSYIIGESELCEKVYEHFRYTVDNAIEHGLNRSDFDRIKKVTVANFVKGFDSTENIATDALYMELDGVSIDEYASLIFEVDFDYVSGMAEEFLSEERCAMMTVDVKRKG